MASVVEIKDLWWRYEGSKQEVLRGVNLSIERGEFAAIMGPSGAGKTTLVLTLNGSIPQRIPGEFRGRVNVLGMDTLSHDVTEIARRVALVFEDPEIQFVMSTVEDEIILALEPLGLPRDEIRSRVEWSLELVGLDKSFLGRHPYQLSGGEKQRVAIATALARQPDILVLDEPTSDLDPIGKEEVISAIRSLRRELDITIVMVEHESEIVAEFADRIYILDRGRVVLDGESYNVFREIDKVKEHAVYPPEYIELASRIRLDGIPRTLEELIDRLRGYSLEVKPFRHVAGGGGGEAILKCRDIYFTYPDGVEALKGVSLDIRRGELIALTGPNGSGKTTLAKIFAGLLKPTRGVVEVLGKPLDTYDRQALSSIVGYVYQNPEHQIFNQSVWDEVAFGLRIRSRSVEDVSGRVEEALKMFNLYGLRREHPFFLSKGEKRRLALASIYVLNPKVLIVDEPTTGQDKRFSEALIKLFREMVSSGKTVIVITHTIPLAARYSDRMIVLKDGRVLAEGSPHEILSKVEVVREGRLITPQTARIYSSLDLPPPPPLSVEEFLERVTVKIR